MSAEGTYEKHVRLAQKNERALRDVVTNYAFFCFKTACRPSKMAIPRSRRS